MSGTKQYLQLTELFRFDLDANRKKGLAYAQVIGQRCENLN